jgi:hypothetical protein
MAVIGRTDDRSNSYVLQHAARRPTAGIGEVAEAEQAAGEESGRHGRFRTADLYRVKVALYP